MSIGRDEVLRVAKLAELAVAEPEVDRLVEQMNRIVDYVAQLDRVPLGADAPPFLAGPGTVTLREDVVRPVPLARGPAEMAPEFAEGLFLVPRRGGAAMAAEAGSEVPEDDVPMDDPSEEAP
ncbi:MAG TPA: aspartyl/glutamyl-tRNA amidotransferase subunit C [Gemmatimonadales bacterium]|nr:aspartyl/glutamyl-tRNA amidotransferase subunit C [Gemmatimonadales bacterium]